MTGMVTDALLSYVKAQLGKGVSPDAVKAALLKAGWAEQDAAEAMQKTAPAEQALPAGLPTPPTISDISPRASVSTPGSSLPVSPVSPTPVSPLSPNPISPAFPSSSVSPVFPAAPSLAPSFSADAGAKLQLPTEPAFAAPEIVSIDSQTSVPKTVSGRKGSLLLTGVIVLLIVGGVGAFAYWYVTQGGASPAPVAEEEQQPAVVPTSTVPETETVAVSTTTIPVEDPDITDAKKAFEMIREANTKKDVALERQYLSKQTLETVATSPNWKPLWFKDFELVSAVKEGSAVVMNINSVRENGASSTAETVFVKEAGVWKLGIAETLQRIQAQKAAAAATSTTPAAATSTKPATSTSTR